MAIQMGTRKGMNTRHSSNMPKEPAPKPTTKIMMGMSSPCRLEVFLMIRPMPASMALVSATTPKAPPMTKMKAAMLAVSMMPSCTDMSAFMGVTGVCSTR